MQVKLNAFRGDDRPGDIIDVSDANGATLIHHGAGFPADDIDAELAKADDGAHTVRGSAAMQATSTAEVPAP